MIEMLSTNIFVFALVAVCFSSSSAIFRDTIGMGSSSTVSSKSSVRTPGSVVVPTISANTGSAIGGAGEAEMNMTLAFKSQAAAEFLSNIRSTFSTVQNLLTSLGNNAGLASSAAFNLFLNPLRSFFDLFQNVVFTSADHLLSVFNQGATDLQSALNNGWRLFYDMLTQGNAALAGLLFGLLAGLQALLTIGNGLSFALSLSSSLGGRMDGGVGGAA